MDNLEERLEAQGRMKEISNQLYSLRLHLQDYPANQYVIDNLLAERSELMRQYIRAVPPYP